MTGRGDPTDWASGGRRRPLQPCPTCGPEHYEITQEAGLFVAHCPDCGRQGQEEESVYDAVMAWRRLNGTPALSNGKIVIAIAGFLCAAVVISVLVDWIAG